MEKTFLTLSTMFYFFMSDAGVWSSPCTAERWSVRKTLWLPWFILNIFYAVNSLFCDRTSRGWKGRATDLHSVAKVGRVTIRSLRGRWLHSPEYFYVPILVLVLSTTGFSFTPFLKNLPIYCTERTHQQPPEHSHFCRLTCTCGGQERYRKMDQDKYLPELMAEKDTLDSSFVHAIRLLAEGKMLHF